MPRASDRRVQGGVGPIVATPSNFSVPNGPASHNPPSGGSHMPQNYRHHPTASPIYPYIPTQSTGSQQPSHQSGPSQGQGAAPLPHQIQNSHPSSSPRLMSSQMLYNQQSSLPYAPSWGYPYPQNTHLSHSVNHGYYHPNHHQSYQYQMPNSVHSQMSHNNVQMAPPMHSSAPQSMMPHMANHNMPPHGYHVPTGHYNQYGQPPHNQQYHQPAHPGYDHYNTPSGRYAPASNLPSRFQSPAVSHGNPVFTPYSKPSLQYPPTSSTPIPAPSVQSAFSAAPSPPIKMPSQSVNMRVPWYSDGVFEVVRPQAYKIVALLLDVERPSGMSSYRMKDPLVRLMASSSDSSDKSAIKAAVKALPFTPSIQVQKATVAAYFSPINTPSKLTPSEPEKVPKPTVAPKALSPAALPRVEEASKTEVKDFALDTVAQNPATEKTALLPSHLVPILVAPAAPPAATVTPVKAELASTSAVIPPIVSSDPAVEEPASTSVPVPVSALVPAPKPKSWADLIKPKAASKPAVNGSAPPPPAIIPRQPDTLADAIHSFSAALESSYSFLVPRGLVNTGNMCYMNSVLQALLYTPAFYTFLETVRTKSTFRFQSQTPLLDAMIEFGSKFQVVGLAATPELLRQRLKVSDYTLNGKSFVPHELYDTIRSLSRFSSMERGHQQDAEEFLGFLLDGLSEECTHALGKGPVSGPRDSNAGGNGQDKWQEVGPKQKTSVTRTVSTNPAGTEATPISKIFSGQLRSELRVPGLKTSVTLEPFQPLQLDIQSDQIHSVTDALRAFSHPETLTGEWGGPRNSRTATKQVFVESSPEVLILHLKRFHYDRSPSYNDGPRKIWKKIRYPLELEIPTEVLSPGRRANIPRYQLTSVIYHHGKTATSGHYTVDVRRQDAQEWVRIDDTSVKRVSPDDVLSNDSSSPSVNVSRPVTPTIGRNSTKNTNPFADLPSRAGSIHSRTPSVKSNGWDNHSTKSAGSSYNENMVAYILFYQLVR